MHSYVEMAWTVPLDLAHSMYGRLSAPMCTIVPDGEQVTGINDGD